MNLSQIKFGWQRSLPDHRDKLFAFKAPAGDMSTLPRRWDWWEHIKAPTVYDQAQTSSCVGQAAARIHHLRQLIKHPEKVFKPSALFIYANARMARGGRAAMSNDGGSQGRDAMRSLIVDGVCSDDSWTFDPACVNQIPSQSCYDEAEKNEATAYQSLDNTDIYTFCSAIMAGPVMGGISIFSNFFDAKDGVIGLPSGGYEGGHMLPFTGFDLDLDRSLFDNSWTSRWGNGGRGSIPLRGYVDDGYFMSDVWGLGDIE